MGNMKITREEFFDIIEIYLKDHLIETERGLQGFGSTGKDINAETVDTYIKNNIDVFKIINLINKYKEEKGLEKYSDLYKKADMDKQLFQKVKNGISVSKRTMIRIGLALELSISEAKEFLEAGGYSFSPTSEFDLIVQCCFEKGYYDIISIDEVLYKKNIPTFSPA